jgi:hypothetical protein
VDPRRNRRRDATAGCRPVAPILRARRACRLTQINALRRRGPAPARLGKPRALRDTGARAASIDAEGERMHTDEYEISIAREVNHCERVVRETREKLAARRERYGMDCDTATTAATAGQLAIDAKELAAWQEDIEALPRWEQRLGEYRQALAEMRISASRF